MSSAVIVFLPLLVDNGSRMSSISSRVFYLCWWTNGSRIVSSVSQYFYLCWWTNMVLGCVIYPVVGISASAGGGLVDRMSSYPVVGISSARWTNSSPDVSSPGSQYFTSAGGLMVLGSCHLPVVGISTSASIGLIVLGCVIYPVVSISTSAGGPNGSRMCHLSGSQYFDTDMIYYYGTALGVCNY
ncbi:MAG: hypothetical protein H0A75_08450 [Candidatus Methanofishera endochildressiae]|uniref:Uncharacterized protein n=1 Tax=Candidatus Methanofishera endochildressiae TaxID=2738884 RepID=A0A7Z0SEA8_9GAMM|nr:hypothetical protein [Candidatus Methanofishera endochildressiae]